MHFIRAKYKRLLSTSVLTEATYLTTDNRFKGFDYINKDYMIKFLGHFNYIYFD